MKNDTFLKSISCAINGFTEALKTEKNYRYYMLIIIITLAVNLIIGVSLGCYVVQFITTAGVFSAECINTAIEHLSDLYTKEISHEIKIIKDMAAGGVLCWGIVYFGCEAVFILQVLIK